MIQQSDVKDKVRHFEKVPGLNYDSKRWTENRQSRNYLIWL